MKTSSASFLTEVSDGIATVILNRPEIHNAFDDALIRRLTLEFQGLGQNPAVRVVVLAAEGKSFSAGADLNWMRRVADYDHNENVEDARALAGLMRTLFELRKPTVAAVQGSAFGGGVGLISSCDVVVAAETAKFALTEVKLGIVPVAISPFVIQAMGPRHARRYMLSGERFDAATAREIGLVHEVRPREEVRARALEVAQAMLDNSPQAMAEVKDLFGYVPGAPVNDELIERVAQHIARVRASAEGREGLSAFLEKRKPSWIRR